MNISDLKVGDHAIVLGFHEGERTYRHKLLAMGLTPKTKFSISRVAPLGDPIEIFVRGFSLSLRKVEAKTLNVEKIES